MSRMISLVVWDSEVLMVIKGLTEFSGHSHLNSSEESGICEEYTSSTRRLCSSVNMFFQSPTLP